MSKRRVGLICRVPVDEPAALAELLAAALGELAHHGIHGLITDQYSAAKTGVPSGMDKLEQDLADGHELIVGLNAEPIWGKPVENKTKDGPPRRRPRRGRHRCRHRQRDRAPQRQRHPPWPRRAGTHQLFIESWGTSYDQMIVTVEAS